MCESNLDVLFHIRVTIESTIETSVFKLSINRQNWLTSIVTALVKTDEHMINLQLLFCKFQQKGKTKDTKWTRSVNVL